MSIQRQSKSTVALAAESPLVLPHGSFVGLGIHLATNTATLTVEAGVDDATQDVAVTMVGESGTSFRYPDAAGANILYNAKYIKVTWSTGTITVFQKG